MKLVELPREWVVGDARGRVYVNVDAVVRLEAGTRGERVAPHTPGSRQWASSDPLDRKPWYLDVGQVYVSFADQSMETIEGISLDDVVAFFEDMAQ